MPSATIADLTDLTPLTAVTAADPYPFYATLAERPDPFWDDRLNMWVAAGAPAVVAVLSAPGLRVRPPAEPVPAGLIGTAAGDVFGRLVRMTDGPVQARLKSAVVTALGRPDADAITAIAAERTTRLLADNGPSVLRGAMFGVPAQVVAVLCGLDDAGADHASRLIADFVQCIPAGATPEQQANAARAAARLQELLGPALDARGSGLLADLVRAASAAGWDETAPLLANGIGLLSQTFDATAGLIGNTLVTLARGVGAPPDSARGWADYVREVARFDAPIQNTRRFAAEAVTIGDARIAAGDAILVVLAAANRDPAANETPDEFRAGRPGARVFTFGTAAHQCPGETVATTIAAAVVSAIVASPGVTLPSGSEAVSYLPLANARIPIL